MVWWSLVLLACCLDWTSASGSVVVKNLDTDEIVDEFFARPAAFGAPLPEEGAQGLLMLADPPDGCSKLSRAPDVGVMLIVLMSRYNCTFEVKIRHAQAAGFGCAIITHNVNSSDIETMTVKHPGGIEIPSVFVSDISGYALARNYLHNYGYYVTVRIRGDGGSELKSISTLLLWIVVEVLGVVIMIGFLLMRCFRGKPSQRQLENGAPCEDKLLSEDTLKGPSRSKEEEAISCISSTVP